MGDKVLTIHTSLSEVFSFVVKILGPEKSYYWLAIVYGIGISVLSLALPISVQMVVNTVAHTALTTPLLVLTLTLFGLLMVAGLLNALRIHLMDLFQRRFYARMVSEIALRSIYALNPFFQDYNKGTLFNRYFDIVVVQKTLPNLLVGGFAIVLQAAVGFVLVSLYHPLFLLFNIVLIGTIWLVWLLWGGRAIRSAIAVSNRKHAAAAWVEGLGASNGFFKSEHHIAEALQRTDAVTREYVDQHRIHFRHNFSQTLCFLFLYALASAGLLGLGGWLVIQGELSLGQLVAAELVLSAVLFGLSQMGTYLAYFYELCAAIDELALFYDVEQEDLEEQSGAFEGDASIEFVNAIGDARGQMVSLDFVIPSGALVFGSAASHGVQREVTNILKRHIAPKGGYVTIGQQDIMGIPAHQLRQQVIVLDRPNAIEMTIREYLNLSGEGTSSSRILRTLRAVDLDVAVSQLEDGLDTRIAATGWPLTISETMQLKLAAAIIASPRVLVLGQLFDTMSGDVLRASLELLRQESETTVIYFSSRPPGIEFDFYLYLGYEAQSTHDSFEELCRKLDEGPCGSAQSGSDGRDPVPAM
ncbi:MAG TPA: ABC transporter ATP-binding protein [Xanthomonadales bacterium]|nr:ABC transporter ATP-binding protein [Xanthomonadales bacterium]